MIINGDQLRDALISASNNLLNFKAQVDALNVFPVPDGDTGTNMSLTMSAAAGELSLMQNLSCSEVAAAAASAMLRGARGNSGVILSLLYRGFSKAIAGKALIDAKTMADALQQGVTTAYKAVMKPTEGTILTVARESADAAAAFAKKNNNVPAMWDVICDEAAASLERTPDLLPVLKKAGVIDAGGMGLLKIYEGMRSVLKTGSVIPLSGEKVTSAAGVIIPTEDEEVDIDFPYCTEYIVNKNTESGLDPLGLRAFLEEMGTSVVFVDDEQIIKIHVHTKDPGRAISEGLRYGSLVGMKIDNMIEQHAKKTAKRVASTAAQKANEAYPYAPVDESREFGFVAVSAGEGLKNLFQELGVDIVVSGGQTMNPSTDDILTAIHAVPAKTVFVLPNNKNIIMAAEQTVKLADRKVTVLPTKTIPQGFGAMIAYDPYATAKDNEMQMAAAAAAVTTGQVTYAARDSEFDGHRIKKGDMLALQDGKLAFVDKDIEKAVLRLLKKLIRKNSSYVTVFTGEDVDGASAEKIGAEIRAKIPQGIELNILDGGQPVYHFIISVE